MQLLGLLTTALLLPALALATEEITTTCTSTTTLTKTITLARVVSTSTEVFLNSTAPTSASSTYEPSVLPTGVLPTTATGTQPAPSTIQSGGAAGLLAVQGALAGAAGVVVAALL